MSVIDGNISQLVWTQLFQVTALIIIVALCVRLGARRRPHLAYALWLVVLAKCLTPPIWTSPAGMFCWLRFADRKPVTRTVDVPAGGAALPSTAGLVGRPAFVP